MDASAIDNIELTLLTLDDYHELESAMRAAYPDMPDAVWNQQQIRTLTTVFPEGQAALKINGKLA